MNKVNIKIINKTNLDLPRYETELSAGCDLRANLVVPKLLQPLDRAVIDTGVAIALPDGYEAQVRGRSGLNAKHGIVVPTGTIDADYRGNIKVMVYNLSHDNYVIQPADRIAQLVIAPIVQAQFEQVESLDETERGEKGLGSTGRR